MSRQVDGWRPAPSAAVTTEVVTSNSALRQWQPDRPWIGPQRGIGNLGYLSFARDGTLMFRPRYKSKRGRVTPTNWIDNRRQRSQPGKKRWPTNPFAGAAAPRPGGSNPLD